MVLAILGSLFVAVVLSLPKRKKFIFEGKHAFITGGSKGIGKKIAFELVRRGCSVSIAARDPSALELTRSELESFAKLLKKNVTLRCYVLDVAQSYAATEAVLLRAEAEVGAIDILINNAGSSVQDAFDKLPVDQFEKQIRLNYLGAVYASRAVVGKMKENGSGHIGFVCSAAGQCPIWGYTAYGASKFAVRGFADALHMELLPYNIGVSVLFPPNTNTEGFQEELKAMPPEVAEISGSAGFFEPEEVAKLYVNDIENGNCGTSVGFEGWMLGVLTAGASPETNFLRVLPQILLGGILRAVMLLYIGHFNRIVAKCKEQRDKNK